jgi:hypothetical protein
MCLYRPLTTRSRTCSSDSFLDCVLASFNVLTSAGTSLMTCEVAAKSFEHSQTPELSNQTLVSSALYRRKPRSGLEFGNDLTPSHSLLR